MLLIFIEDDEDNITPNKNNEMHRLSLKECQLVIEESELKIERKRLELQKLKHKFNTNK